jgi:hypothetical protein
LKTNKAENILINIRAFNYEGLFVTLQGMQQFKKNLDLYKQPCCPRNNGIGIKV